jgi:two-component system sensor histidine kinase DesK
MAGVIYYHSSTLVTVLSLGDIIMFIALQLYVSWAVRDGGRPGSWPVILAVQAMLVFAFSFGFSADSGGNMAPFLAASILLLVPGWRRWTAYAAVVVSSAVLFAALPLSELGPPFAPRPLFALVDGVVAAEVGLMVYGLSRLAWRARELEGLRDQLGRMAAVRERLRVARDVHDLLGLGLSAVALKADLIGALLGRDDTRAAAELEEMCRICAVAHADIRQVTGEGAPLSLARELDAAREILVSAGVEVRAGALGGPLPAAADEVLAPVLREAVTNVLRHATARTCGIEVTISAAAVRLAVSNDGVTEDPSAGQPAGDGTGRGLANMRARVEAAAGRLTFCRAGRWFTLTAEIPLAGAGLALAVPWATVAARPDPVSGSPCSR